MLRRPTDPPLPLAKPGRSAVPGPLRIHTLPIPTPFPVGPVNIYLVEDEPLTLIDSGVRDDESWASLNAQMAALGYDVSDIGLLLTTHAHMDHYGQMARVQEACGAPVWAPEGAASELARRGYDDPQSRQESARATAFFLANGVPADVLDTMQSGLFRFDVLRAPLEPARLLREGDVIPFAGGELGVIHTPGHIPGHACFLDPHSHCLVSGDHLLPDITPVPLLHFPADPAQPKPRSLCDYVTSVAKLSAYDIRRAVGGHGRAITNIPSLYENYGLHQKMRSQKVLRRLQRIGPQSGYDINQFLFPRLSAFEVFLGMSEAIGHLELLEDEGRVRMEPHADGVRYAAVV